MVNADRVKRKLAILLCDGATTDKKQHSKAHRIERGLKRLKTQSPEKYQILEARLIYDLEAFEKAINRKVA